MSDWMPPEQPQPHPQYPQQPQPYPAYPQQPQPYPRHSQQPEPYPEQPQHYPQYPEQPGLPPQQFQPYYQQPPQNSASGGTAIAAAVLSFLGAAHQTLVAITGISDTGSSDYADTMQILPGWWKAYSVTTWVSAFFVAIVLIVGGVQLLRKRSYARWLIVGASGIVIAIELVAIVILADLGDRIAKGVKGAKGASSVMVSQITGMGTAVLLVLMIFPIVTILLTLLPPTKRWCLQRAD